MPFRMGPWEIGLILMIILIVFGVGKLPQVGSALGKGMRAFRKGQSGEEDEDAKRAVPVTQYGTLTFTDRRFRIRSHQDIVDRVYQELRKSNPDLDKVPVEYVKITINKTDVL